MLCAGNVSLYVYDTDDIVSNQLRSTAHTWEATETEEFLWAIKQFQATRQLQLKQGAAAAAAVPSVPLVVDIGANIGWFTLNAAAAKCRVAAFEGKAGVWATAALSDERCVIGIHLEQGTLNEHIEHQHGDISATAYQAS